MTMFFEESGEVSVSRITREGWWVENTIEHVVAGTALGKEFTQNVYTPSKPGKTAKYDDKLDTWSSEIDDRTHEPFWDSRGQKFVVGSPDGTPPKWAVTTSPPEFDSGTHTVLFHEKSGWTLYEILIGQPYFDEFGVESVVSDYYFVLPDSHTFESPPVCETGFAPKLTLPTKRWEKVPDHRGQVAYSKNRVEEDFEVTEIGELPSTHTLLKPTELDKWDDKTKGWIRDTDKVKQAKAAEETAWQQEQFSKITNALKDHEEDQKIDVAQRSLRIYDFSEEQYIQVLTDRKKLADYLIQPDFPDCPRPTLSGLAT
ncbi:hypothetical protein [Vibrio nigripulchritudo]|uniref:hypothetical protein n=1 Tax=Vibrio nigripulchritudo TaxID=28173 RepID=UPI0005F9C79B|nr:hypothetical protein [Vibrio nigripulchritudo]KJY78955.1 hypothetical protein TW74_09650 [Vibrio nigripulchritudo]